MRKHTRIPRLFIILTFVCLLAAFSVYKAGLTFADSEYNSQEGLAMINAAKAYQLGFTGKGILVGILDSGINASHAEFKNRPVFGIRVDKDDDGDEVFHGSHVAGIIGAARDGVGMHGVAYNCELLVGALNDNDYFVTGLTALTDSARWGGKLPLIINNSWGFPEPDDAISPDVTTKSRDDVLGDVIYKKTLELIYKAVNQGQLMIFSAGNDDCENLEIAPGLPYLFPELNLTRGLVAVVSVDMGGKVPDYSSKAGVGKYWTISAPGGGDDQGNKGVNSVNGGTNNGYVRYSGTSMAAPHVSGAAALVWEAFPHFTSTQVAQMLFLTADNSSVDRDYSDMDTFGWGLLNVGNAVQGIITRDSLDFVNAGKFVLVVPIDITINNLLDVTVGEESNLVLYENYTFEDVTVSDGGILTVNRELTAANIDIDSESILKGSGTIANSTVNIRGTLAPGSSPGVLTIKDTNINIDNGIHQPFLSEYGYSQLLLSGASTLTLSGDVWIDPYIADAPVKIGGEYTVLKIQDTSQIIGRYAGVTPLNEPGIQFNSFIDSFNSPTQLNLYITPQDYTKTAAIGINFNENQAQIAHIWQSNRPQSSPTDIVDLSTLTKDQQELYPLLYAQNSTSLRQAASQMSGQLIADTRAGMFNQMRSVNEFLSEMHESGEEVKIFGQELRINDGQFPGGNLKTSGIIVNHQLGSSEKSRYGVGVSIANGKQYGNDNLGRGTIDSYSLHLYQNTYQPNGKYWFAQLGLGQTKQEINRQIMDTHYLNSSGTGSHFFAGLGAGKARDLGQGNLKLETALFWENAKSPSISESGNQTFVLNGNSSRDDRLAAQVLLKRNHVLNSGPKLTTVLTANIGISHDFKDLQSQANLELLGSNMSIRSEKLSATALKYGLGVSWNWNKNRELRLMASGERRSNANKAAIELSYKIKY